MILLIKCRFCQCLSSFFHLASFFQYHEYHVSINLVILGLILILILIPGLVLSSDLGPVSNLFHVDY